MHGSLKFSVVWYRTVKTKERVHSNKEAWQNYRNKARVKWHTKRVKWHHFTRAKWHAVSKCTVYNYYLTHQQFHEVSTFRNLLSIINLFARMLTSVFAAPHHFGPQNNEKRANSFLRLQVLHIYYIKKTQPYASCCWCSLVIIMISFFSCLIKSSVINKCGQPKHNINRMASLRVCHNFNIVKLTYEIRYSPLPPPPPPPIETNYHYFLTANGNATNKWYFNPETAGLIR